MSTNKERLIAALQEPLETTLTRYKTHLDGLKEDQVEENRDLYGENVITKGQEDHQSLYCYSPSHCSGFLYHQCLAC